MPQLHQMRIITLGYIILTSEQPALETQEGICTCLHGMVGAASVGEETRADVGSLLDLRPFPILRGSSQLFQPQELFMCLFFLWWCLVHSLLK